ncbi:AI-2E family transporter [Aliiglaciecola sp. LCG003]|uniref:AI-2E family transporter n=1 Tax=Aliiglaciecola sp. LCG003 TaxID=3053655 RepID=UPI002572F507|nr:AI-2E family transporter [Aliiglaciecola sp. LCG003]WJG11022.1 AI-2E family transporter [Aliiglaciecola sp. LCG003]
MATRQANEQPAQSNNGPKVSEGRTYYLRVLVLFATLYTLYFAQTLLIPLVLTILTALLLSPLVNLMRRLHIPRPISALVLVCALVAPFSFLSVELAEPVQKWAKMIPELSEHLTDQLDSISDVINGENQSAEQAKESDSSFSFFGWFSDEEPEKPIEETNVVKERIKQGGIEIMYSVLSATPFLLAQILTSIILILFLLIYGPDLFRAYINGLPQLTQQKRALSLLNTIQKELSTYIVTISIINTCLGLVTALVFYLLGMKDALLWGVVVGLLNYVPYLGSLISLFIISAASMLQFGMVYAAAIPPLVYITLNLIEAQFITPTILGRNMRLNPLVVIVWLLIWGWLWGAVGVLLAVPLLVCLKLVLSHMKIWTSWIKVIEAGG